MNVSNTLFILGCALLLSLGCQDPAPTEESRPPIVRASVRDSAGVQIVENRVGIWTAEQQWRLSPEPDLRMGTMEGDPAYMFERITGAVTLSDGRIVLGDRGASTLRVYDASGRWIEDAGGPGEGPGEFASIRFLDRFAGDSILVFDWSNQRYSIFSPTLVFQRAALISVSYPGITLPSIRAVTESGIPILIGARPPWVDEPLQFYGQPGHLLLEDSPGSFDRMVRIFTGKGKGGFWETLYATTGEHLAVVSTGAFRIELYDLDGQWIRSIRREMPPSPIPQEFFDADPEDPVLALTMPDGQAITMKRGNRDPADYPPHVAFIEDFDIDPAGNFWVRHYRYRESLPSLDAEDPTPGPGDADEEETIPYSIFNPEGQLLGDVDVPMDCELLEAGDDWLLCLVKDDLDVEYIERYRIEKPPGD